MADDRLGRVAGRHQTGDNAAVLTSDAGFGVDNQTAGRADVAGVHPGGIERALFQASQRGVRLMVAVGIELVVFVFATVEVLVDAAVSETVEPLNRLG